MWQVRFSNWMVRASDSLQVNIANVILHHFRKAVYLFVLLCRNIYEIPRICLELCIGLMRNINSSITITLAMCIHKISVIISSRCPPIVISMVNKCNSLDTGLGLGVDTGYKFCTHIEHTP